MSSLPTSASSFPVQSSVSDAQAERAKSITLALLDKLTPLHSRKIGVRLWDDTLFPDAQERACTIVLKHPGSLRAMFATQDALSLAESYLLDVCDVEGDWNAMFDFGEEMSRFMAHLPLRQKTELAALLFRLPKPHPPRPKGWRERAQLKGKRGSIERAREAVAYHYNVPTEFYAAFLDPNMAYSCAVFQEENESLGQAQIRKFDGICRALQLKPGQRLLDVGCGWGGFLIYAAKNYGVDVTGITLSESQAEEATRRIHEEKLESSCRVWLKDYRELDGVEPFDAIASIEMFEHVGRELLSTYFSQARQLLKTGGLFFNQGTTVETDDDKKRYPSFIEQYVFPDGEIVPVHLSIKASEESGLEVLNVHSIRPHYARTCAQWASNLEEMPLELREKYGEPIWRIWHLYTAVSGHGFRIGRLNCYQTLMRKN
jgi:cyclopropane-fatty-acyl-phospholipid synthase